MLNTVQDLLKILEDNYHTINWLIDKYDAEIMCKEISTIFTGLKIIYKNGNDHFYKNNILVGRYCNDEYETLHELFSNWNEDEIDLVKLQVFILKYCV